MTLFKGFTGAFEELILDHIFADTDLVMPADSLYVGLGSGTLTEEVGSGLYGATEIATGDYARVAVALTDGWTVSASATINWQVVNAADITFAECSAGYTITNVLIFDNTLASGTSRLITAAPLASTGISIGQTVKILAGTLKLGLT